MSYLPEQIHTVETAIHHSFLNTLSYCASEAESIDSFAFTQCVKAAGVNFGYTYGAFQNYKFNVSLSSNKGLSE